MVKDLTGVRYSKTDVAYYIQAYFYSKNILKTKRES